MLIGRAKMDIFLFHLNHFLKLLFRLIRMDKENFDIIIAGAGLSGLTLALECARRPFFQAKKVLLIDRDNKEKNDRTWCFWATDDEVLPPVIYKTWNHCRFFGKSAEVPIQIAPYRYHMVRGIDFYQWAKKELSKHPNIQRITAQITAIDEASGIVYSDQGDFRGTWVFNSALTSQPLLPGASALYPNPPLSQQQTLPADGRYTWLLQHFKGWLIETPEKAFDPEVVTIMDYRPEQKNETRFVYVLPFDQHRAMVEFTVFSPALCSPEEYDNELKTYIRQQLNIQDYTILEEEFGVIPMTDFPLHPKTKGAVMHIGTVGGFVKASSGYAFKRTQRKIRAFVDAWEKTGSPDQDVLRSSKRFRIFDAIMLRVLRDGLLPGHVFFHLLFKQLKTRLVFRFLDEDTTFAETLRLLLAPPALPFLKALFRKMGNLFTV